MLLKLTTTRQLLIATYFALLLIPQMVYADKQQSPEAGDILPVMPEVHVEATRITPTAGTIIINKEMIENLPTSNGNLTELLQTVPGVQLPEQFENSSTAGEIKPPEISISGGRTEDNTYILDGISNNSLLDPSFTNVNNEDNIPGHSQEIFILDHLISNIKIYRANIPVKYGGFSGGVIEAETIDPSSELSGRISYNTTHSTWGKFHIEEEDKDNFFNSTNSDNQPKFKKNRINSTLNIPLNATTDLLIDYARLDSKISLQHFDEVKTQYRENNNLLIKLLSVPKAATELKLSAIYAPYKEFHFLENVKRSDYKLIGGGWKINGQIVQDIKQGQITANLNYRESYNSRKSSDKWYSWRVTPSKSWGSRSSLEGGYGDIEKKQKTITTNVHLELKPITNNIVTHFINTGFELSHSKATFNRTETLTKSIAKLDSTVVCLPGDRDCVTGEQFIFYKKISPSDAAKAKISNLDYYLEDKLVKERFILRPGIRISYNNFQKNTDIAPRFLANIDIWNNGKSILTGGLGRYYNTQLLTLKLEEQKGVPRYYLRSPTYTSPWREKNRKSISSSRTSSLNTPYSDEWSLGLQQSLFCGQAEILYINRSYREQIISVVLDKDSNGFIFKEWQNSGKKDYEEIGISWSKQWRKYFLSFNVSWQKSKSNSSTYADIFSEEENENDSDYIWYDDELILREELPPNNFNRPIKASIVYITTLPYGFTFSNTTNFKDHYKALVVDGKDPSGLFDAYSVTQIPSSIIFDWKITWASPSWKKNSLICTLDILNVFDKKAHYGPEKDKYLLGRQFWAGLEFNF